MSTNIGLLLEHFCRIAANDAGTSAAVVAVFGHRNGRGTRQAAHGLSREQCEAVAEIDRILTPHTGLSVIPDMSQDPRFIVGSPGLNGLGFRFLVHINLMSSGDQRVGFICLLDEAARPGLTPAQHASLDHIAAMVMADRRREQRHLHLMHVADRALRFDRMLRMVSDAATCADALSRLLEELCVFHGAASGRVWQLMRPDDAMIEIGRYPLRLPADDELGSFFAPAAVQQATIEAIRRNLPKAIHAAPNESGKADTDDSAAGAVGHVCIPIWVRQQRFGIALTFTAEDWDLDLVVADISSLADTIRPILFRKVAEERIRFAAHHDDLTQLSNRLMFQERLHQALDEARAGSHGFALLYLDLDGFKQINDTHGHEMGDRLLVSVAERLRSSVRETDTVARMGGDEFAIIQHFGSEPSAASSLAERLLESISAPFDLAGRPSQIGVSIGIAFYPQHGDTSDLLIRHADIALYRAKRTGRNTFRLYASEMQAGKQERMPVAQDLRDALDGNNLTLAFQPVCACNSLRIVGFEALLRWNSAVMGPVPPERFIQLAEHSGLIVPLGRWALEAACVEAATWDPPVTLSVNLSPVQFRQRDLPEQIAETLRRTGLPATRLELEVTEGVLLDETELVLRTMRGLQAQGIRITLDDFGTAYASLSYLRRFPFDGIKIDKSFIRDLCDDATTLMIVQSILSLGERLELAVVAEGVETERVLGVLRELGCRYVQGYLSGRPCESDKARALLRTSLDHEHVQHARLGGRYGD